MSVRPANLGMGVLLILLLAAVPVSGAPSLQKGKQADYKLSASISFLQSCGIVGVSTLSNGIVCPMMATIPSTIDINGTLGWTATDLSSTTALLNVTRDLTISSVDSSTPVAHSSGSFNESINLTTRIINIIPVLMPEIDQALQMAQTTMASSLPTGVNLSSSMSMLDATMMYQPVYTMWWVNGPLKQDQTIPVLVLPTNVTGTTSVDLGGNIGARTGWVLTFSLPQSLPAPDPLATLSSIPVSETFEVAFTFIYDQTSDLLLSANADIHLGFGVETSIPPSPCDPSTSSTTCPMTTTPTVIMREFGVDIQASLTLDSTNLDLTQRMTPTVSPQDSGGSQAGTGSGSGTGSGTDTGSGSSSGTGGTTSATGQPASNAGQPRSPDSLTAWLPWIYVLLGIVAAAIIGAGVWIARRRKKRTITNSPVDEPVV
jgi:hypothetical protein